MNSFRRTRRTTGPAQARRRRRRLAWLVTLALIAAAILAAASEAATPGKVFTSTRYGYSLVLPRNWTMQQTPGKWPAGAGPQQGSPGVDAFWYQARTLLGAARSVTLATTLAAWARDVASLTPAQCRTTASVPARLAGTPAHRWEIHCPDGATVIKIAALHRAQGYLFALVSLTHLTRADRAFFVNVLRTFKFTS